MDGEYAGVVLLDAPQAVDHPFTYFVPPAWREALHRGSIVTVPFGVRNTPQTALVVEENVPSVPRTKPIREVRGEEEALNEEMLRLCVFMREQTLCTWGDAVRAMVPAQAMTRLTEFYRIAPAATSLARRMPDADSGCADADFFVYRYVEEHPDASLDRLKAKFGADVVDILKRLTKAGLLFCRWESDSGQAQTVRVYMLGSLTPTDVEVLASGGHTDAIPALRSVKQRTLLATIAAHGASGLTEKELSEHCGPCSSQLKALVEKGLLSIVLREVMREPAALSVPTEKNALRLNEEQTAAFDTLCGLLDADEAKAALLYGVTGSGKTSVMLALIDRVVAQGKSAIVLLPEIALTPQSLGIFCSRYGKMVAVIHSGLSGGERLDAYRKIKRGDARVVVGTRSAVFSPVKNLGLLVIDEEQEHTYKSDMNPKYHARDIARFRCAFNHALMMLASATPSLESFHKAREGKYSLVKLTSRYGGAVLPAVTIADMREEIRAGNHTPLGMTLTEKLIETWRQGNQSILFLNRRGYNSLVTCRKCGVAVTCPSCSVAMPYHTHPGTYTEGELICHWCGKRMPVPVVCPACGSEHISRSGFGTQRIEEELSKLMPGVRVLRMDTDSTGTKDAYDRLLGQFRSREADILLGTQMVTKGHDFPDVTLVGVLLADASLYLDDYRAAERTFALLTQVIGRAGRGRKRGEAVIQTNNPDSEVIRLACAQDYEGFFDREIRLRRALVFPPFCDIAALTLTGSVETEVLAAATRLKTAFDTLAGGEYADMPVVPFGPFEAPVYRVDNRYRMRMVVKCKLTRKSRAFFSALQTMFLKENSSRCVLSIDFNPSAL